VYVLDWGNNRVEVFNSEGVFQSEFTGPAGTGNGTVTSGSATITEVTLATGAFSPGEEVTAEGVPAGTTILKVEPGTLELSAAATANGKEPAEPLTAHQSFSEPVGLAVDNACQMHKPQSLTGAECEAFDVSNGDVYVADGFSNKVIDKFSSTGAYIGQVMVPVVGQALLFRGVAVDRLGQLWVAESQSTEHQGFDRFSNAVANEFKSFVSPATSEHGVAPGLAVDSKGDLYSGIDRGNEGPFIAEFISSGAMLSEALDEEESGGVATELSSGDVYVDNVGTVARFGPVAPGGNPEIERFGAGHLPSGPCEGGPAERQICSRGGVAVDSATGHVYVAVGPKAEVQDYSLAPPGPPAVQSESVSKVTGDSASLGAELHPEGAASEYWFEYGPCATPSTCPTSAFQRSAVASVGSPLDFNVYGVELELQGLLAHTAYHFRVVAANEANGKREVVEGEEQTFITQTAGGSALPDGRQWELVSPPDKHGAQLQPIGERGVIQASAAGNAITYFADAPTEAEPLGYTNEVQVLSTRAAGGWGSQDIAIPHIAATGLVLGGEEYRFFSGDLSLGMLQPFGAFNPSLSEEASEQTAYLRTNYLNGDVTQACLPPAMHCYRPLVTGKAGSANVPPGTHFSTEGECPRLNGNKATVCGPEFVGATPDLTHVVLESTVALTTTPFKEGPAASELYEWSAGKLAIVSVLPGEAGPANGPALGFLNSIARHAISNDGSRVVWSTGNEPHLFLRENATQPQSPLGAKGECEMPADACTVQLDEGLVGLPRFQAANTDVSQVFFTDGGDLYDYSVAQGKALRLTEGADVQGAVLGSSEDGSNVYFVANGVVAAKALPGKCAAIQSPPKATCNLYVKHYNGSEWEPAKLVAVLSGEDFPDWGQEGTGLESLTARVSPNGRWLAFMSQRRLPISTNPAGYDNRDAFSGKPDEEVFIYDASTGHLVCASCNPTGARPVGVEYSHVNHGLVGGDRVWPPAARLAANIPSWTPYAGGRALYQSRYLSDSGRLFFNSNDALVPRDVNGTWDVYQYEPPGVPAGEHACTTSSVTFSERSGGCVGLISSGTSPEESGFLDASETGGDVFFLTAAKLAPQDFDTSLDVYDAHECSSSSPCLPVPAAQPPSCTTASCRAAPTPQPGIFGAPASATFSGVGNLTPASLPAVKPLTNAQKLAKALGSCRRKYRRSRKRRAACERQARAHFAKRSNVPRRKGS
jgi:hypothetical protein